MGSTLTDGFLGNIIVLVAGAFIMTRVGGMVGTSPGRAQAIYWWHTLFAILYVVFAEDLGADALGYFDRALRETMEFKPGSGFVQALTAFLANGFGLSFTGTSFVFAIFGAIGLLFIDSALARVATTKPPLVRKLASWIVFLPSASFWSVGLGKDSVAMMASGLFVLAALPAARTLPLLSGAAVTMFFVRPHIAALMIGATVIANAFGSGISWVRRIVIGGMALGVATVAVPFVITYVGLDEGPTQTAIEEYVEKRQSVNMGGGSSVDLVSMNPAMRVFTYLFRPMLFEGRSAFMLAAAIENSAFLLLFVFGLWSYATGVKRRLYPLQSALLIAFICTGVIILSQTTANLGLAMRQKWMILPMMLVLTVHMTRDGIRYPVQGRWVRMQ